MAHPNFSRRNFISAVAASGVAGITALPPLQGWSHAGAGEEILSPNRDIHILSFSKLSNEEQKKISSFSDNIKLTISSDRSSPAIADAEVIIGSLNADILQRAKKLRWVQWMSAGVENMPKELVAHPAVLTNMQRVLGPVIAETAIALLLSLTRGITQFAIPNFQQKKWVGNPPAGIKLEDLYKKTIGIVGLGGIGSETARRLHYGFSMRVLATDAKPMHTPEYVAELHDPGWFMNMVPQVDVLMSAAPLTKETKEMFNTAVFAKMKPDAYFINVSRGGLVEQPALISALKNKKIRGAGLDVATPEPLPADHELWTCPNLVLTAHNSSEADSRDIRMSELLLENIRRYAAGLPLMNVVDKEKGY